MRVSGRASCFYAAGELSSVLLFFENALSRGEAAPCRTEKHDALRQVKAPMAAAVLAGRT